MSCCSKAARHSMNHAVQSRSREAALPYSRYAYGSPSALGATVTSAVASNMVGTGRGGCCAVDFLTLHRGRGAQPASQDGCTPSCWRRLRVGPNAMNASYMFYQQLRVTGSCLPRSTRRAPVFDEHPVALVARHLAPHIQQVAHGVHPEHLRAGPGVEGDSMRQQQHALSTSAPLPCCCLGSIHAHPTLPFQAHLAVLHRHALAAHAPRHLLALEHLARVLRQPGWRVGRCKRGDWGSGQALAGWQGSTRGRQGCGSEGNSENSGEGEPACRRMHCSEHSGAAMPSRTWQAPVEPAARCASELPCEAGWPEKPHRFITPCGRQGCGGPRRLSRPLTRQAQQVAAQSIAGAAAASSSSS